MSHELSSTGPSKEDTDEIFKRLRSLPCNKVCFDCASKYPTWSSVTYGVFICLNCSAVHRSLGVHFSFVRSTLLDSNWTWKQIRQMQLGGNANAEAFFHRHNCLTKDAKEKYSSRGAMLYRQQLNQAAHDSLKKHGSKIYIDDSTNPVKEEKVEEDFFSEHSSFDNSQQDVTQNLSKMEVTTPKVAPLEVIQQVQGERKSIIGHHRSAPAKQGLGGRSKGLGASKVKTNFADIEKQAELSDKLKIQEKKVPEVVNKETTELEEASMRLAYEDLSLKQSQEVQKIQRIDPQKAKQVERLGMGFISKNGVSHTATSDMKKIEQENPIDSEKSSSEQNDFFEEIDFISPHVSSFYMYNSSNNDRGLSLFLNECQTSNSSISKWSKEPEQPKPIISSPHSQTTSSKSYTNNTVTTDEAQKKFGSAKSISSQQFFSDSNDNWNEKSNMSKFEGSSSISSAEYFGRNETSGSSSFNVPSGPDFDDVKESVKQGVTKVAGKLGSLANGVISSLQEKYGY